ncbi:MAG: M48 family metalloprotease [Sulfuricella sp.]|jgi:predicted Zn-dependent protease|nr:M48 family metalloprotease [Sulfuricella sp.]
MKLIYLLLAFGIFLPRVLADGLPDLGDASQAVLSPQEERRIGESVMSDIRGSSELLDDAEVTDYLNSLGARLVASSEDPARSFEFFVVKDATLNAFALPGGYIGVHTGLILSAQSESELASVLAHEIAHVTQHHLARMIAGTQKNTVTSLAALAVAILASRSNPQMASAAMATAQATGIQSQLDYTREHEREADRIGLQTLERAGFDPRAMENFFERLQKYGRLYENNAPVYLRTHPLTTERIADVQNRVEALPYRQVPDSLDFQLARARVEALQGDSTRAIKTFQSALKEKKYSNEAAQHYGLAVAFMRGKDYAGAEKELALARKAAAAHPMFDALAVQIKVAANLPDRALDACRSALKHYPHYRALIFACAETQLRERQPDAALALVSGELKARGGDYRLYQLQAEAYAALGKNLQQHMALAEAYALSGSLSEAVEQLQIGLKARDGDFYHSSIAEARLRQLRELAKEARKQAQH